MPLTSTLILCTQPADRRPGRIVTFYSYKGGTGRSMALANIAWLLAMAGQQVLVVDWDLEAPGLHRYFHPFLKDKELRASEGIIDFVIDFEDQALPASQIPADQELVPDRMPMSCGTPDPSITTSRRLARLTSFRPAVRATLTRAASIPSTGRISTRSSGGGRSSKRQSG